jgi:hypothetical protein
MNIWLVTIGSSDVQLKTDEDWHEWYRAIKRECYKLPFKPSRTIDDSDDPYRIAPRVLGTAYADRPDEVWEILEFPLLKEFTAKLQGEAIAQIILLLTDQSQIFDESQREDLKCPYWQDTCELQPIFERYFQTHFPRTELVTIQLAPESGASGLDDWNAVLDLVRSQLKQEISVNPTTVYVSHQAGTPAISSAVQFCSLAQFGDRVKFLVSNEYNQAKIDILPSSNYLIALKRQQAAKLLERHDYSGVRTVYADHLSVEANVLLDAAIQWNFAEFSQFEDKLKSQEILSSYPQIVAAVKNRTENWWWTAYEAAYLGVVRLKQGNTVEAMFHSFRAVEGLLKKWMKEYDVSQQKAGKPRFQWAGNKIKLPRSVKSRDKNGKETEISKANPYGKGLYFLLDSIRNIDEVEDSDIWTFGNSVFDRRNELFHQLGGLQDEEAVFAEWQTCDEQPWKTRVVNCLNFIVKDDLPNGFGSPEDASLMVRVHEELVSAIAQL